MGSYIGREEEGGGGGHAGTTGRPRAGQSLGANPNPREQLRERLSRPNHAVYTPNRRLSFTRETLGSTGKFTITPQRHYPLLQAGTSSVGVLPPANWDSFKKKNILSPRNHTTLHSPVTVKIARPDHSTPRPPVLDYLSSPGFGAPPDPCSTEGVLRVLKESRKREVVEDDDGSVTAESKRRRNDSGGSSHSAFEPLLPNGMTSQLVPKPGTLKRGINSVEESVVKRSRTSSISSGSGAPARGGGTPGSARNPINSSYSSSRGFGKWKKALEHDSPLSSPASSRPQTPERALKKPREEYDLSPSSVSMVTPDKAATNTASVTSKLAPVAKAVVSVSSESTGSGGKRKRRIQLVSSQREDQIYLPPPPELGYTVTGKDLDLEKMDALSKIQKSLEEPEQEKPGPTPAGTLPFSQPVAFNATALGSLLAAPLPAASTSSIPVINLDPTPSAVTAVASNPLLEALKTKGSALSSATVPSTVLATAVSPSVATGEPKPPSQLPPATTAGPGPKASSSSSSVPSAFTQVLGQTTKPPAGAAMFVGTSLFGMSTTTSTSPPAVSMAPTAASTGLASSANSLLAPTAASTGLASSANSLLAPTAASTGLASSANSLLAPTAASTGLVSSANPLLASTAASTGLASSANPLLAPTAASTGLASSANSLLASTGLASSANPLLAPSTGLASSANPLLASGFKPIFMATAPTSTAASAQESKPTIPTFKPIFGSAVFGASPPVALATTSASATNPASSFFTTAAPAGSAPTTTQSAAQPAVKPLFETWGSASATSATSTPALATNAGGAFQFGAAATVAPPASTTAPSSNGTFTFGSIAAVPAPTQAAPTQAAPQNMFAFGQGAPGQKPSTASFGGFAMSTTSATTTAATTAAPTTQSTFTFAKSAFDAAALAPATFPSMTAAPPKPFSFGAGGATAAPAPASAPAPYSFGAAAATTAPPPAYGTQAKPAFGAGSSGFPFGSAAAPATGPSFGISTQTQSAPTSSFTFGNSAPQLAQSLPSQPASGGFNFGSAMSSTQFGTPVSNNPATQMAGFNFGAAATDKPAFGTPTFGQSAAAGPTPFGSPATPIQGFNSAAPTPFGSASTPSFSIGAGSKPSGARQRLQARRQHTRKK